MPAPTLLKGATTRIIYDLDRFRRTQQAHPEDPTQWLPVYAATLARETHVSDPPPPQGLKIQVGFSYSDGFGREIQKKIQAEPGPLIEGGPVVSPRWVGSGWIIFNNKGKPVRQYEPFFSQLPEQRHRFEFGVHVGVSSILFYNPVERVVATLHPNHTYEKVVFDLWQQTTYDVNDTVAAHGTETGDPRTDMDIKGYVAAYFTTQPTTWQTWYQERITGAKGALEHSAAEKAAQHANTPTTVHFDTLGRPILTLAHNGFQLDGTPIQFPTRVKLDIEGNQREVLDAKNRIVMRYDYDMIGNCIHQASMEAGERWMLNDVAGKPIRAWDSRGFARRMTYDELRRPTGLFVTAGAVERLAERTVYGESQGVAGNHLTRVFQVFDGAGVVTSDAYDFKGNLLRTTRQLAQDYQNDLDWSGTVPLEASTFMNNTVYDALNRAITITLSDNSVVRPTYNEPNLLERLEVNLRGAATTTAFINNIDYNAKGQRLRIVYGNRAETTYEYDEQTLRLTHLITRRDNSFPADRRKVQDLRYTYDPVGNLSSIRDDAQQPIFFNNSVVTASSEYLYDAIYRLIGADGREHIGQNSPTAWNDEFRICLPQPGDGQAMRNYCEAYEYDEVGNLLRMIHQAQVNNGNWTRTYDYNEPSLLEPARKNNRLSHTAIGSLTETCAYTSGLGGEHGSITSMPHLSQMVWDFEDQLQKVDLGGGGTAYYVYDAAGQRIRKVIHRQNGTRHEERLYLGGFESYREYNGSGQTVMFERESLHVMDEQETDCASRDQDDRKCNAHQHSHTTSAVSARQSTWLSDFGTR